MVSCSLGCGVKLKALVLTCTLDRQGELPETRDALRALKAAIGKEVRRDLLARIALSAIPGGGGRTYFQMSNALDFKDPTAFFQSVVCRQMHRKVHGAVWAAAHRGPPLILAAAGAAAAAVA